MKSVLKYILFAFGIFTIPLSAQSQIIPDNSLPSSTQPLPRYPGQYSNELPLNTITTWVPSFPTKDPDKVIDTTKKLSAVTKVVQYMDGLGRAIQTVNYKGRNGTKDIVSPVVYDSMGRTSINYMPYVSDSSDGKFKQNPFVEDSAFYMSFFNPTNVSNSEKFFFSKTEYENSPHPRITKTSSPGNSWVGSDRGSTVQYEINKANEVRLWSIDTTANAVPISVAYYQPGTLFKSITADEHGHMMVEYKDKQHKVVLKKFQLTGTDTKGHDGWLCTYYVYDLISQLRFVISPKAVDIIGVNGWNLAYDASIIPELCFSYSYDHRGRMNIKRVPGSGEVHMVYDVLDRPVMTQDALQREKGNWLVTVFDPFNRNKQTVLWSNNQSRAEHEALAADQASYPSLSGSYELLSENYYDNYTWVSGTGAAITSTISSSETANGFLAATDNDVPYARPVTPVYTVNNLQTGRKEKVLGTSTYLYSVRFYDDRERIIQTQATNMVSGTDILTTQYSFDGRILVTKSHSRPLLKLPAEITVLTKSTYNDEGQLLSISKKINTDSTVIIARNSYNKFGQLETRRLGQQKSGSTYTNKAVTSLIYQYTSRGWLSGINQSFANNPAANDSVFFGQQLSYDYGFTEPQYGGNIAGVKWSSGDLQRRSYGYHYDNVNRLLKADFNESTSGISWNRSLGKDFSVQMGDGADPTTAYDFNGNILRMDQRGVRFSGSQTLDSLLYTYLPYSNKLQGVLDRNNDTTTRLGDFRSSKSYMDALGGTKTTSAIDYAYNVNGNLVKDLNKDIDTTGADGIEYNHLNLPTRLRVKNNGSIQFTYAANGDKLSKVVKEPGKPDQVTLYMAGGVYQNDTLQFIGHEEGRIRYVPQVGVIPAKFIYDYFIKDYLGSVRTVLTEDKRQDVYPAATLEGVFSNAGQAVYTERQYFRIDSANIALNAEATGITSYQNNNGNPPYNTNPYSNTTDVSAKLYRLLGSSSGGVTGLSTTIKVMAGDTISILGRSYYFQNNTSGLNYTFPVLDVLSGLLASPTGAAAGKGATAAGLNGIPQISAAIGSFLADPSRDTATIPKAYINYILFDEQFNLVKADFSRVGVAGTVKSHYPDAKLQNIRIPKNGFLFVYCSNESPVKVFFDNLQVIHSKGPVIEETHYYPFGLTMAGISSKALDKPENNYKYNGNELESHVFSDGSGLELYDFNARTYDPQIGRFHAQDPMAEKFFPASPYSYVVNNPILLNDPTGKDWTITITQLKNGKFNVEITVNAAVVNSSGKNIDMANYIRKQSEVFKSLFSMDRKDFSISARLNMREVKSETEATENEHLVVIGNQDEFDENTGGRSHMGGLRIDINGGLIDKDGTTAFNNTLSHELGHTGGLDHPWEKGDNVSLYRKKLLGMFDIYREAPAYNQKGVDLRTNFMSYFQDFNPHTTQAELIKLYNLHQNPGGATRGQIAAIMRYYFHGFLNNNDK